MRLIQNFDALATSQERKICLELIEAALSSIQPEHVIQKTISLNNDTLSIQDTQLNLNEFERIFLIGFGKGSASLSRQIENLIGNFLTEGYVIDLKPENFSKIELTLGAHPLPSKENFLFTKKVVERLKNLTEKDLVLIVIAGGGSALFVNPYKVSLEKLIEANKMLLKSGATISEMNVVRKHLSLVKGGGLAKLLYPAQIVSIIASDVPGNDLSVIASGPTVKDTTTKGDAFDILKRYNLWEKLNLSIEELLETPKEDMYFRNISNILILSNQTALEAMEQKAVEAGYKTLIESYKLQGDAKTVGKMLIDKTPTKTILLAGGETTLKVEGKGQGGRNQELVLNALPTIPNDITIASFDSDGWDNSPHAGAIADITTLEKAKSLNLILEEFLQNNNTFPFFQKVGDGIITNRLPSNVSDLMIVIKK